MRVRRNWHRLLLMIFADRHVVGRNEIILWLFGLGWLRVVLAESNTGSLVANVIDPAGAAELALFTIAALGLLGAAAVLTRRRRIRIVHISLAAAWWSFVWVLTYLQVTPVRDGGWGLRWLPTTTTAYSYLLIAVLAVVEAIHVARRRDDDDDGIVRHAP